MNFINLKKKQNFPLSPILKAEFILKEAHVPGNHRLGSDESHFCFIINSMSGQEARGLVWSPLALED